MGKFDIVPKLELYLLRAELFGYALIPKVSVLLADLSECLMLSLVVESILCPSDVAR